MTKFRCAYEEDYDPMDYATPTIGESMTQQQFQDQCYINQIMDKYQKTGVIDHFSKFGEDYGEVDGATFQDAMEVVANAQNMFNELPSAARERFDHDPARFLDFVDNLDEKADAKQLLEMGIIDTNGAQAITERQQLAAERESAAAAALEAQNRAATPAAEGGE